MLNFYTEIDGIKTYVGQIKGVYASDDTIALVRRIASYVFPNDAVGYGVKVGEGYIEFATNYGLLVGEELDE